MQGPKMRPAKTNVEASIVGTGFSGCVLLYLYTEFEQMLGIIGLSDPSINISHSHIL